MRTIEYRVVFGDDTGETIVRIQARTINSGFTKAVKAAREPLGNGRVREIAIIEFWRVV